MSYSFEASPSIKGREKLAYDLVASQGANRIDRILERGLAVDFTNAESNALSEVVGQLKAKRTHFFHDPKQVSLSFLFCCPILFILSFSIER